MKALTLAAAVAVMVVSPSCRKEMAGTQDLVKEGETIQVNINAGLGDFVAADATKATATPVVSFEWEPTDKVDAYYGATKISGDARISVTPSKNKIFAKLSGTIDASGHTIVDNDIITFVYSNVTGTGLAFDFSSQGATIPFVAYATVKWSEIKSGLTDNILEFKFATSVMKIAATGLDGRDITNATINGINTKVTLAPQTSSETVTITGSAPSTITKNGGIEASSDKTRAIFTVGLVPDDNTSRKLTINGTEAALTSSAIEGSKSYTTPCAFESSDEDEYVEMKMGTGDSAYTLRWAKKNLGASGINGYGELYSWGEVATKFNYSSGNYDSSAKAISKNLDKADGNDVANAIKGGKWRMPTSQEFEDLADACGGSSNYNTSKNPGKDTNVGEGIYWCTNYDGVAGCLFCDGTNKLFFPAAGNSYGTSRTNVGKGYYWSSTWSSADSAYRLYFYSGSFGQAGSGRYYGMSVRPVSD